MKKLIKILVIIFILIIAAWAAVWFGISHYAASFLNNETQKAHVEANVSVTGFPFNFNIHATDVKYHKKETNGNGIAAAIGEAKVNINIFDWMHPQIVIPRPVSITTTSINDEGQQTVTVNVNSIKAIIQPGQAKDGSTPLMLRLNFAEPDALITRIDKKGAKQAIGIDMHALNVNAAIDNVKNVEDATVVVTADKTLFTLDGKKLAKTAAIKFDAAVTKNKGADHQNADFILVASDTTPLVAPVSAIDTITLKAQAVNAPLPPFTEDKMHKWVKDKGMLVVEDMSINWSPVQLNGKGAFILDNNLQPQGRIQLMADGFSTLTSNLTKLGFVKGEHAAIAQAGAELMSAGNDLVGGLLESAKDNPAAGLIGGLLGVKPKAKKEVKKPVKKGHDIDIDLVVNKGQLSFGPFDLMNIPKINWKKGE